MNQSMISIGEARTLWNSEQYMELGKRILDPMPLHQQPIWAARILKLVYEHSGLKHEAIETLLEISSNPDQWKMAKPHFSVIRRVLLEFDQKRTRKYVLSEEEKSLCGMLVLAEQTAKVTYNATDPFDEFDEDSGYWLVPLLHGFVKYPSWQSEVFSQKAWNTLMDFS